MKIGDKYLIPKETKLWFIDLQLRLTIDNDLIVIVTHTITENNSSFFGDLYDILFKMTIPSLIKIPHGHILCDLDLCKPVEKNLEPNEYFMKYL